MKIKLGINGLGRIGRNILRCILENNPRKFSLIISDIVDIKSIIHLIKYDSTLGTLNLPIRFHNQNIMIGNEKIIFLKSDRNNPKYYWNQFGVETVIDATGQYSDKERLLLHQKAGAKKLIITAPSKNADFTVVMGINESSYNKNNHHIISNASCTTNCLVPLLKIIDDALILKKAYMNTIHSYTSDQRILDNYHRDARRGRTAQTSIIPTTTGAITTTEKILPRLKNKLTGIATRVPTSNVSFLDLVFETEKSVSREEINELFKKYSQGSLSKIIEYIDEPLVSIDFKKNPHSAIFDSLLTSSISPEEGTGKSNLSHVVAWYDNEWGYSNRIIDLIYFIEKSKT